jgi:hypothetical protein
MAKDFTEIDRKILEAIQSYSGIPTARNLSKKNKGPLKYSTYKIQERLKKNPRLKQALESRGLEFVKTCEKSVFYESITTKKWNLITGEIRDAIDERLDRYILEAIRSFQGIPNARNLSKDGKGPFDLGNILLRRRLNKNPELQKALEFRGIEFVKTCERKTFDESIKTCQWVKTTGKTREAIDKRLDKHILEAIQLYQGIPTASSLNKIGKGTLNFSESTIAERLEKNPELRKALETRSLEFVKTCARKTFDEFFTTCPWTFTRGKIRRAIDEKLDKHILEAIQSYQGIPTASSLSKKGKGPLEYSDALISIRLKKNPELQKALESRSLEYLSTCDRKTFDECIITKQWTSARKKIRDAINKRLDKHILEVIKSYPGIPTASNLSKKYEGPLEYGTFIIRVRLKKNPKLANELEFRGLEFARTCDRETFDKCFTTNQWINTSGKIREAIVARLDKHILEAINSFPDIPMLYLLSKEGKGSLEYSCSTIKERLKENPELRRAFYLKRGLTEDRINALEAEQDYPSTAFNESIKRRLPNTRIFREALGILKQFRDSFSGESTMEVSFYPEPLGRAAQMLGISMQRSFQRAHKLKSPDFKFETSQTYETAVFLQFCHRLRQESLINAFNEANRILVESGTMLISLPEEYARTPEFMIQVQDFGFELTNEGTLYTKTLSIDELASLGIENPGKLKQKVEQATNLILLVKTRPAKGQNLDCFVPASKLNGNGEFIPAMDEINTPESILADLSSIFARRADGLEEGFILSVLDDRNYTQRHVVGYDVDPKSPKTCESYSEGTPILDPNELSLVSRRMFKRSFREKVLVRPGKETRIPARLVKRALG